MQAECEKENLKNNLNFLEKIKKEEENNKPMLGFIFKNN
jgi:hypothetical protein